ncbi:MAG: TonB family protein [Acidobacteria bacterium]|nr:TonB family protein [Acidobacteriota bacterium]
MVHFDFDDRYLDDNVVGHAISRRDGVVLSVVFHLALAALLVYGPEIPFFRLTPEDLERRRAELEQRLRQNEERTFVFVQPRVDLRALEPPLRAPLSDEDRLAQAPERAPEPENPLPLAQGNTPERVEEELAERARGEEVEPVPPQPETQIARADPLEALEMPRRSPLPPPRVSGSLGEALRNLQRYIQNQTFDNPQGGADTPGATIQFDTKGVEFGPWLRRFVAQVRRNWFIPQAAMFMSGHVVLQFNIHRDGRITDVVVVRPSTIDAFTNAAYGAIVSSNPTEPLPPEYPADKAFFTVTFYYNEQPPLQ